MSPRVLVLADDLTGANDAGVQFASAGLRTLVRTHHRADRFPLGYPVLVVNTESRHLPPAEAAERVFASATDGRQAGIRCFYKKTDSTLRGNIAAELQALLRATGADFIPFVPALPDLGRVTRDGIHYVHGVPIAETAFSRDPLNPVRQSRVTEVLAAALDIPTCSLKPGQKPAPGFHGIGVLDCSTPDDLAAIARTHGKTGPGDLQVFAGSVALARYLLGFLRIQSPPPERPAPRGPILLVNGSLNERALAQIQNAATRFCRLRLTPEQLLGDHTGPAIPGGPDHLLIHSASSRADLDQFHSYATARGLADKAIYLHAADRTGWLIHQILREGKFGTLVVFGGDTLAGIARTCQWDSFIPLGEIAPGLSVCRPDGTSLTLVSKAGGFGGDDAVDQIVNWVESA